MVRNAPLHRFLYVKSGTVWRDFQPRRREDNVHACFGQALRQ